MSELIYPKTYYYRGGVSDKKFVLEKMAYIPDEKKQRVADEYERLFAIPSDGRELANKYLSGVAKEYWQVMFNGKQKA